MQNNSNISTKISIIPYPTKIQLLNKSFILNSNTILSAPTNCLPILKYFKNLISYSTGFKNDIISENQTDNVIRMEIDNNLSDLGDEGYQINCTEEKITIKAFKKAGVFYGCQSIRQLLPVDIEHQTPLQNKTWEIPCVKIEDIPKFSWRGFMFDVGRHFHEPDTIKRMLDLMALMKLNIFHWHLTEDQGWRIEIKKYPKLTEIGSKRKDTQIDGWSSNKYIGKPHEGYYTQDQIKEIVQYAKTRFITIVPEIEMPGHCMAALTSYPELSCTGGPFEIPTAFGIKKDVYCAGKEIVFEFLFDVLDEVMELFPSEIIHIGGDEVPKDRWKECLDCQTRIKTENLSKEEELQAYFTNRIAKYLKSKGRLLMGWNEIINDNLEMSALIQWWMGDKKKLVAPIRKGNKAIMSDFFFSYLDYSYNQTPLKKTYSYEPIPKNLELEYHENILGVEAPIWTEWVPTIKQLDWQVFLRLVAIAEVGWSQKKNYDLFLKRIELFLKRLDKLNVQYAPLKEANPKKIKRKISRFIGNH